MSGFVGLNTSDVPRGSGVITQVVWGHLDRVVLIDPQGREQATKDHIPYRALRCPPERRVMRARCQPMRDRLNPFAVFLLTARSPWLAGRSQAQHMPEPAILFGSHPWPPTPRTSVPDRWQPEASIRRAS
jgi:hypothetical protein